MIGTVYVTCFDKKFAAAAPVEVKLFVLAGLGFCAPIRQVEIREVLLCHILPHATAVHVPLLYLEVVSKIQPLNSSWLARALRKI